MDSDLVASVVSNDSPVAMDNTPKVVLEGTPVLDVYGIPFLIVLNDNGDGVCKFVDHHS
jgi:hypothetical protein